MPMAAAQGASALTSRARGAPAARLPRTLHACRAPAAHLLHAYRTPAARLLRALPVEGTSRNPPTVDQPVRLLG